MTNRNRELAEKVVKNFQASLNRDTRKLITEAELDDLTGMIEEALAVEKREIAELIEAMVMKLKAEAATQDISL
ncbi:MAG TPA: hypothetical protein VIM41_15065 [Gammaproteobacteria bacterium]